MGPSPTLPHFPLSGAKIMHCFWTSIHEILGKQIPAQSQARGLIWDPEKLRRVNNRSKKKKNPQDAQAFTHKKNRQLRRQTSLYLLLAWFITQSKDPGTLVPLPAPAGPTAAGAELTHSFSKSTGHNQCRINYYVRALVKSIKIRAQI